MIVKIKGKKSALSDFFIEFLSILAFFIFTIIFLSVIPTGCSKHVNSQLLSINNQKNYYFFMNQELLNLQIPVENKVFNPNAKEGTYNVSLRTAIPIFLANCRQDYAKNTESNCKNLHSIMLMPNADNKGYDIRIWDKNGLHNIIYGYLIVQDNGYHEETLIGQKRFINEIPYTHCNEACTKLFMNITLTIGNFFLTNSSPFLKQSTSKNNIIKIKYGNFNMYISSQKNNLLTTSTGNNQLIFSFLIPLTYLNKSYPINYSFSYFVPMI